MSDKQDLVAAMKAGMRHLASGVAVVATRNSEGQRFAMTVTSITSISDQPPSILVCLHRDATTYRALESSDFFSANILQQNQQAVSDRCAFIPGDEDRFTMGQWQDYGLQQTPYLEDALTSFICRVKKRVDYGTHVIVIADIETVLMSAQPAKPLIYLRGGYVALASKEETNNEEAEDES